MKNSQNNYIILGIVAIIAVIAILFLMQPKDRPGTKLGRAVEDIGDGIEDAADEMKPEKSPGEKIDDAVEDAGDRIQDAAD